MDPSMRLISAFDIFIAGYAIYYAIKGEGRVYDNEYPKEMQVAYTKLMRNFCWVLGIGMLPLSVMQYVKGFTSPWSLAVIFFGGACVIVFLILNYKWFRKPLKENSKNNLPKKKN